MTVTIDWVDFVHRMYRMDMIVTCRSSLVESIGSILCFYDSKILDPCIEIAPILHVLSTKSLEESRLPSEWLKTNVSPIFKKAGKPCPASYRPISLICLLCKLLEHIITSNLVKHLDRNSILYELQHGFRAKRSLKHNSQC